MQDIWHSRAGKSSKCKMRRGAGYQRILRTARFLDCRMKCGRSWRGFGLERLGKRGAYQG